MSAPLSIRLFFGLLLSCGAMGQAFADEDPARCPCWYGGYDDYTEWGGGRSFCDNPPPGTMLDECELIHTPQTPAKDWWRDGCLTAVDGGARQCPYKA